MAGSSWALFVYYSNLSDERKARMKMAELRQ